MKKYFPWILVAVFAAWVLSDMRAPKPKEDFNVVGFGRLPVLLNGRVQPFDSVAKNVLLNMSGKSIVRVKEPKKLTGVRQIIASFSGTEKASDDTWLVTTNTLSATEWLLEAMTRPELADTRQIFRVQHPDLESMMGSTKATLKYYSFNGLTNQLEEIEKKARALVHAEGDNKDAPKLRTPFQKDLMHLYDSLILFHRIKSSLGPVDSKDFAHELTVYKEKIAPGLAALQASEAGEEFEQSDLQVIAAFFKRYQEVARFAYPLAVPPLPKQDRGCLGQCWRQPHAIDAHR